MKKTSLFLALILSFVSLNTYNISLFVDGPENPLFGNFNRYYSPTYPLGTLYTGYSISIKASIRNKNQQDISSLTLSLYQSNSLNPSTFTKVTFTTSKKTSTSLEYSYNIVIPGALPSAQFFLQAVCNTFIDFNFFILDVVYYNTTLGPKNKSAKAILKVA